MKTIKFKDFVKLQRGFDLPKSKRINGAFPLVASTKIDGSHSEYKVKAPGVVTGRSGSLGQVQYITKDFWPLNTTLWAKDFKENNEKYVYYFLQTLDLAQYNSGAGVPTLNRNHLDELEISIHNHEQQLEISMFLSSYDKLIENNNRRIAILEDMAQSLYREWFVNFRYPNHEDNLNADGNPKLIDSPLGQIPEGWEVKRLDDYVTLQRGFDLPKAKRNNEGDVPIYAASGLTGYHDEIKAKGPGVVTGRSGTLGIVKLVLEDHWPLNTSLWVKKFENCTAHYAYYLLDSIGLERFNSGASVPTLNRNDVHGNPVIAPTNNVIDKFENIVSVKHKQINVLKRKNENLKQQRDMLLPKLISGTIAL